MRATAVELVGKESGRLKVATGNVDRNTSAAAEAVLDEADLLQLLWSLQTIEGRPWWPTFSLILGVF